MPTITRACDQHCADSPRTRNELAHIPGQAVPESTGNDAGRPNIDRNLPPEPTAEVIPDEGEYNRREEERRGDDSQQGAAWAVKVLVKRGYRLYTGQQGLIVCGSGYTGPPTYIPALSAEPTSRTHEIEWAETASLTSLSKVL
jgi:hypothetical protein